MLNLFKRNFVKFEINKITKFELKRVYFFKKEYFKLICNINKFINRNKIDKKGCNIIKDCLK